MGRRLTFGEKLAMGFGITLPERPGARSRKTPLWSELRFGRLVGKLDHERSPQFVWQPIRKNHVSQ